MTNTCLSSQRAKTSFLKGEGRHILCGPASVFQSPADFPPQYSKAICYPIEIGWQGDAIEKKMNACIEVQVREDELYQGLNAIYAHRSSLCSRNSRLVVDLIPQSRRSVEHTTLHIDRWTAAVEQIFQAAHVPYVVRLCPFQWLPAMAYDPRSAASVLCRALCSLPQSVRVVIDSVSRHGSKCDPLFMLNRYVALVEAVAGVRSALPPQEMPHLFIGLRGFLLKKRLKGIQRPVPYLNAALINRLSAGMRSLRACAWYDIQEGENFCSHDMAKSSLFFPQTIARDLLLSCVANVSSSESTLQSMIAHICCRLKVGSEYIHDIASAIATAYLVLWETLSTFSCMREQTESGQAKEDPFLASKRRELLFTLESNKERLHQAGRMLSRAIVQISSASFVSSGEIDMKDKKEEVCKELESLTYMLSCAYEEIESWTLLHGSSRFR